MKLFKHQQEGIDFAIKTDSKCALFHDPGLGKTRTTLETYAHLKASNPDLKLLIICPMSLINSAWGEDNKKFTKFSFLPLRKVKKDLPDIVAINYESLISKKILPIIRNMIIKNPFMCVLDESSRLKNNKSITTKT